MMDVRCDLIDAPQRKRRIAIEVLSGLLLISMGVPQAVAQSMSGPHSFTLSASDVEIGFALTAKESVVDENRVDSLTWDTTGSYPLAANEPTTGPKACTDPVEYFGQAEGYPDASLAPRMVIGGQRAIYASKENLHFGIGTATTYTGVATCASVHEDGLTRTEYTLSRDYSNSFKVSRLFRFNSGLGVVQNTGLRPYIPRAPMLFHYVLVPNSEGQLVTYDSANCTAAPCAVTDWNGSWFADYDGSYFGFIVIRNPGSTTPAFVGIQSGGLSNSNFTSVVLPQPTNGWSGVVTETEYVCFFTQLTWTVGTTLPNYCLHYPGPSVRK